MIKKIIKLNIIFLLLLSFCSCKNKSDNNSNNNKRDTIICPECKMENPKSSLYCGYCGISIDDKKICLKCEIEYSIDKKYCLKCGESLTKKCTHDWIDATCTTPKTCKKCLITKDSELGHDYGNWKQIESGIGEIRKCNRCNFEETRNFDLEIECISKVTIYNYKKIYNNNKEYFVFLYDSEKEIADYVLNTLIQYYNYTTKKSNALKIYIIDYQDNKAIINSDNFNINKGNLTTQLPCLATISTSGSVTNKKTSSSEICNYLMEKIEGEIDLYTLNTYSTTPYDDNVAVNLRVMENRKSKYDTGYKNELGEHEKSTFDIQITLVKLQTQKAINNIRLYVAAKTVDGSYRFKEYSSSSKTMSEYTYTSVTSFSSLATKEFVNNELLDNTPETLYIKVSYTVSESNIDEILTYKVDVLSNNESKLSSAELRSIISNNAISNPSYVDPVNDPVRLKLTKEEATEETKLGSVKYDSLKIQFNVLKENLNKYKLNDDILKANKLISIEISKTSNDEDSWDVLPEIKELKFEIYAKVKSTDKDFSEYVKIYSVYGFLSKYRDLSIATAKLDESFDVENIYIVVEGKLHNATQDSFSAVYSCKYSDLYSFE